MLTDDMKKEAAERGAAWGKQEAELMAEAIENGHRKEWPEWTDGQWCGWLPHDSPAGLDHLTAWEGRTEEQDAERTEYEDILDRAAEAAYDAAGEEFQAKSPIFIVNFKDGSTVTKATLFEAQEVINTAGDDSDSCWIEIDKGGADAR